jgi:hypothetical protein
MAAPHRERGAEQQPIGVRVGAHVDAGELRASTRGQHEASCKARDGTDHKPCEHPPRPDPTDEPE